MLSESISETSNLVMAFSLGSADQRTTPGLGVALVLRGFLHAIPDQPDLALQVTALHLFSDGSSIFPVVDVRPNHDLFFSSRPKPLGVSFTSAQSS